MSLFNINTINEIPIQATDIAQFRRISIPLTRRVYPRTVIDNITSVQSFIGPTMLNFYLNYRYADIADIADTNETINKVNWKREGF